ncbi:hypothetical protein SPI_08565 [Niveomyces insectorum RCEF 264]|uniref:Aminoglycoside phosphotransferase n=1 Tax=Niveomyces insectorum RCEF 264 TaxID=1081102 RepID=A0A167N2V9_9HYPO|nr:hypothetical protein SPI_08565 [Niveomyces insectorum RCEF 264]
MDTIRIGSGRAVNFSEAYESEADIISLGKQWNDTRAFRLTVWEKRRALERLVAFYVGADAARVAIGHPYSWRQGAFNVVVPMLVFSDVDEAEAARANELAMGPLVANVQHVVLRCPVPGKCAEAHHPGSVLEKMRCEAAAYVWMQRQCADVRIPYLYGFGLPDGTHFAHTAQVRFVRRALRRLRQWLATLLGWPVPSDYVAVQPMQPMQPATHSTEQSKEPLATQPPENPMPSGYMVLEHLGPSFGRELPFVVQNQQLDHEPAKMRNLFRDVSRILLAVARIPQPRIGAFRFNHDGTISLDNRPVTPDMFILENEGAPRTIPIDKTYTSTEQYVTDLATFHDERFLAAPNAVTSEDDCRCQMAIKALFRSIMHRFINKDLRNGPFALYMGDSNAANMFVDEDWNVTAIYDLEWLISGPIDLPRFPSWLTWDSIDHVSDTGYAAYNKMREMFMEAFKAEERLADTAALEAAAGRTLSSIMEESWLSKQTWIFKSLLSVNGLYHVTQNQFAPMFYPDEIPYEDLSYLWAEGTRDITAKKVADRKAYVAELAALFGRDPPAEEIQKTGTTEAALDEETKCRG